MPSIFLQPTPLVSFTHSDSDTNTDVSLYRRVTLGGTDIDTYNCPKATNQRQAVSTKP